MGKLLQLDRTKMELIDDFLTLQKLMLARAEAKNSALLAAISLLPGYIAKDLESSAISVGVGLKLRTQMQRVFSASIETW